MTTIVYHEGHLYTDRRHVTRGVPTQCEFKPKYIATKFYAYATSGKSINLDDQHMCRILRQVLIEICLTFISSRGNAEGLRKVDLMFEDGSQKQTICRRYCNAGILIARDFELVFHTKGDNIVASALEGNTYGLGTGGPYMAHALKAGLEPLDAYNIACKYDPYSGGLMRGIPQCQFEPFILGSPQGLEGKAK